MMAKEVYIVNINPQDKGEHEVHRLNICKRLPVPKNRRFLGDFSTCAEALERAKEYYQDVDGCFFCCPECHSK